MRSAGVGIMFLIERVNQRLMTHPTNKTPAMIRNVVGHQPEQAGGPVPAPRVPSLPNQLAINKRAEGSMKPERAGERRSVWNHRSAISPASVKRQNSDT